MRKKLKCQICLSKINSKLENWNKLETYTREVKDATFYFHDKCYTNYLKSKTYNNPNPPQINHLIERANLMLDGMGIDRVVKI